MKASKNVTAAVFAAALIGGIGLAYAQDDGGAQRPLPNDTLQNSAPRTDGNVQNQAPMSGTSAGSMNNTQTPSSTTDTSGFQTERPAQPDRN